MKKMLFLGMTLCLLQLVSQAQCDKPVNWKSSKTEYLDASRNVQGGKDENVVLELSKTNIKLIPNQNEEDALSGTIKEVSCNWKEAFKNGTTVIKSALADAHGDIMDATITIEAKEGKITILLEAKEMPDRKLRLLIDSYEEKAG